MPLITFVFNRFMFATESQISYKLHFYIWTLLHFFRNYSPPSRCLELLRQRCRVIGRSTPAPVTEEPGELSQALPAAVLAEMFRLCFISVHRQR